MNDAHFGFILASYAIGFAVIAGVTLWTVLDYRAQAKALALMEARSGRRRGEPR